ncbi:MAG: Carbohydrate-selective porin OprB [Verrucomicrobiaceae bacterium]|nr:Carbohydrate-selective porin OprB [Verrucomicrobiaceae bacterium]
MNLSPKSAAVVFVILAATCATLVQGADDTVPQVKIQSARELFSDQPKGLSEHIAAWKFIYAGETFGNLSGGLGQGAIYEGMAKFGVGINLEKLAGWEGASFYVNTIFPHGDSLTQRFTGDLNVVSNIDTYDSLRLYKLWLQKIFDDGKWSIRVGQIAADKECFVSDGASLYFNNAFGTFAVFSSNIPGPIFPLSAPGARVHWAPTDAFSVTAMAFSGDVGSPSTNPYNTDWQFHGRNGALSLMEMAYKTNQADGSTGLPGTFKLGGYYDSKSFADQSGDGIHHGDYGLYAMADQLIYREPGGDKDEARGLGTFVRAGLAPQSDRNIITFDCETGLNYTGLLPERAKDITGIGFAFTRLGDPYVRANEGTKHHEAIVELTHLLVLNDHFSLQPDFQYIAEPGGLGTTRNAFAAGLRFTLSY